MPGSRGSEATMIAVPPFDAIEQSLKKSAAALQRAEIPFLLGGSLASWARGGPETRHDLDLLVRSADAPRAIEALEAAGLRPEYPPEDWLFKAWDEYVLVDVIFRPKGLEVDDAMFARAETLDVSAMHLQVVSLEDLLHSKLAAMDEHTAAYGPVLAIGRALREQINWELLREQCGDNPFAAAYFALIEGLGIAAIEKRPSR